MEETRIGSTGVDRSEPVVACDAEWLEEQPISGVKYLFERTYDRALNKPANISRTCAVLLTEMESPRFRGLDNYVEDSKCVGKLRITQAGRDIAHAWAETLLTNKHGYSHIDVINDINNVWENIRNSMSATNEDDTPMYSGDDLLVLRKLCQSAVAKMRHEAHSLVNKNAFGITREQKQLREEEERISKSGRMARLAYKAGKAWKYRDELPLHIKASLSRGKKPQSKRYGLSDLEWQQAIRRESRREEQEAALSFEAAEQARLEDVRIRRLVEEETEMGGMTRFLRKLGRRIWDREMHHLRYHSPQFRRRRRNLLGASLAGLAVAAAVGGPRVVKIARGFIDPKVKPLDIISGGPSVAEASEPLPTRVSPTRVFPTEEPPTEAPPPSPQASPEDDLPEDTNPDETDYMEQELESEGQENAESANLFEVILGDFCSAVVQARIAKYEALRIADPAKYEARVAAIGGEKYIPSEWVSFGILGIDTSENRRERAPRDDFYESGGVKLRRMNEGLADQPYLVCINPKTMEIIIVSLYRDMRAPEMWGLGLNHATYYWQGIAQDSENPTFYPPAFMERLLENITGVAVDGSFKIDIDGAAMLLDALHPDGVKIDLADDQAFISQVTIREAYAEDFIERIHTSHKLRRLLLTTIHDDDKQRFLGSTLHISRLLAVSRLAGERGNPDSDDLDALVEGILSSRVNFPLGIHQYPGDVVVFGSRVRSHATPLVPFTGLSISPCEGRSVAGGSPGARQKFGTNVLKYVIEGIKERLLNNAYGLSRRMTRLMNPLIDLAKEIEPPDNPALRVNWDLGSEYNDVMMSQILQGILDGLLNRISDPDQLGGLGKLVKDAKDQMKVTIVDMAPGQIMAKGTYGKCVMRGHSPNRLDPRRFGRLWSWERNLEYWKLMREKVGRSLGRIQ
ncbi:MAG: hypothetical protein U9Q67_00345 [Patescibacteria group bacterium]|nr:hypothetical protein [Patescibacteria group bacterium]